MTFGLVQVIAFVVFVQAGRRSWFAYDDWDFLANRTAGDLHGLHVPHGDHWSALPILTYRALWQVFGLRFGPYLVVAVVLHLTSAALLRVVMRRANVDPWIATAAASLYALFGAGYENTTKLFALGFAGWPIVLGLSQLILADHDGPWNRRDWLGLAAGFGAIASSGVGVPMVVAVGVATFLRRGARTAAAHTLPLAAIFVAWHVSYADSAPGSPLTDIVRFVQTGLRGIFVDLGQSVPVAIVLVVVLVVGFVFALQPLAPAERRAQASLPLGMLLAAVAFFLVTGHGRASFASDTEFGDIARLSHYVDVAAVLVLPSVAVGATAISRRLPALLPLMVLLFVIGIPGNLAALDAGVGGAQQASVQASEQLMLSLPRSPQATEAPPGLVPEPLFASPVTMRWLLSGLEAGKLPAPPVEPSPELRGEIELRLSLRQTNRLTDIAPCIRPTGPVVRTLDEGEHLSLGAYGYASIALLRDEGFTDPITFGQSFGREVEVRFGETLTALRGPLTLRITPIPGRDIWLCG